MLKDCVIQNVGSTISYAFPNRALQILYGDNQVNIEGLVVKSAKTYSVGIVHTNSQANVNIKDLSIDGVGASANSFGFRVENQQLAIPVQDNSISLAGNIDLYTKFVQVQDYTYDKINIPDKYRFVQYYIPTSQSQMESVGS